MKILLKNAFLYSDGKFAKGDILVEDGALTAVGGEIAGGGDAREISLEGLYAFPGLVDVHVHFREPGFSYKETVATGTAAAARGGYTTVCTMPNLNPAPDNLEHLREQLRLIEAGAVVKVIPYGTITEGQAGSGRLADMESMKDLVAGFSDDGRGVQSDALMEEAMRVAAKSGKPIVAHCEVDELLRGGYIHDGVYARAHGHRGICSESEWRQVERDIELVRRTGCQYHVCHISTGESVELVRSAKAEGLRVSCETAPHYLILCDEDLREDGCFKMNPPIRSRGDRAALIEGIKDGTIDVIATDHAPHSAEEKSKGLEKSAFGIVGLETAFPLLYTHLVLNNIISLERLIELMSGNPRRIFGIGGGLKAGMPADIAVFDLDEEFAIDPEEFASKGRNTPFGGWMVKGGTVMTMVDGRIVYAGEKLRKNV